MTDLCCEIGTPALFAEYKRLDYFLVQARWVDLLRMHQRFPELERIPGMHPAICRVRK